MPLSEKKTTSVPQELEADLDSVDELPQDGTLCLDSMHDGDAVPGVRLEASLETSRDSDSTIRQPDEEISVVLVVGIRVVEGQQGIDVKRATWDEQVEHERVAVDQFTAAIGRDGRLHGEPHGGVERVTADVFIAPGVTIGEGAVVNARSAVFSDVEPWMVVTGNPAKAVKIRVLKNENVNSDD